MGAQGVEIGVVQPASDENENGVGFLVAQSIDGAETRLVWEPVLRWVGFDRRRGAAWGFTGEWHDAGGLVYLQARG